MRIELPFPPTVNNMFPSGKNGRRFLSKAGKAYRLAVHANVLAQHGIVKPLTGPLSVSVHLIPPDRRKRDIDNYHKALFDSLGAAGVFEDDSQIEVLHVLKGSPSKEKASAIVTIRKLSKWVEEIA